jgi:hypothetical protein
MNILRRLDRRLGLLNGNWLLGLVCIALFALIGVLFAWRG